MPAILSTTPCALSYSLIDFFIRFPKHPRNPIATMLKCCDIYCEILKHCSPIVVTWTVIITIYSGMIRDRYFPNAAFNPQKFF